MYSNIHSLQLWWFSLVGLCEVISVLIDCSLESSDKRLYGFVLSTQIKKRHIIFAVNHDIGAKQFSFTQISKKSVFF